MLSVIKLRSYILLNGRNSRNKQSNKVYQTNMLTNLKEQWNNEDTQDTIQLFMLNQIKLNKVESYQHALDKQTQEEENMFTQSKLDIFFNTSYFLAFTREIVEK
jgi:hypothetical protein